MEREGGKGGRKGDKEKESTLFLIQIAISYYFIQKNYLPNMYLYIWEAIHTDCVMMC